MNYKRLLFFLLLGFLAFGLIMFLRFYATIFSEQLPDVHISVIMYGDQDNDRWKELEQGAAQACQELSLEAPVFSVASAGDVEGQWQLVQREIEDGADGLLIAVEDSDAFAEYLQADPLPVPVVYLKNAPTGQAWESAMDADMSRLLAQEMAGQHKRVALLPANTARENVRLRRSAFLDEARQIGLAVTEVDSGSFPPQDATAFVALDSQSLEEAAQRRGRNLPVYGIGSGNQVSHALNQGKIEGVVFHNEYALGYLATMRLAQRMGVAKSAPGGEVEYRYVDRTTMFLPEMEHLLFPFTP